MGTIVDPYRFASAFANNHSWQGNGTTQYAINNVADYRSGDSQGTICGWLKSTDTTGIIFGSSDHGTTIHFIQFGFGAGKLLFNIQEGGTQNQVRHTTTNVNDNTWRHVGIVSTGAAYKLYINGVSVALTVDAGVNDGKWFDIVTLRDSITIGVLKRSSLVNYYAGLVANLGVFSVGFSDAEVTEAYNLVMGDLRTHSQGASLVGGWHFPNGQADFPIYTDYSGAGNDMTMTNQASTDIVASVPP